MSNVLDFLTGVLFIIFFVKYWIELVANEKISYIYLLGMAITALEPVWKTFLGGR